jgi:hypothetical protein
MSKQTALQYFIHHLILEFEIDMNNKFIDLVYKADEMEQEQIANAFNSGVSAGWYKYNKLAEPIFDNFKQYYNQTYKGGQNA